MDIKNTSDKSNIITSLKKKVSISSDSFIAITFIVFILIVLIAIFPDKFDELYITLKSNAYSKGFSSVYENGLNEKFPAKSFLLI